MVVKVAWVSRHLPVEAQVEELQRKLGDHETFYLTQTFRNAEEVYQEIKKHECQYAVVVLPLSMIARLVTHKDITWLWAEMEALHNCNLEECTEFDEKRDVWLPLRGSSKGRHMRFKCFKKIVKLELVLEEWNP